MMHVQSNLPREQDGSQALRGIEKKRDRAQTFAAGADHVGSADIAAALGADVLLAEDAHENEAEGNRAQQVSNDADDPVEQHGNGSSVARKQGRGSGRERIASVKMATALRPPSPFHINRRRTRSSAACAASVRTRSRVLCVENAAKFFSTTSISLP